MEETLYRPNAGIIIFNKEGKLLWCKRKTGDGWQFPQGGIDKGESPEEAILRETYEEVGLHKHQIKIIKENDRWICLLYTSPSPRDQRGSRMPSSA